MRIFIMTMWNRPNQPTGGPMGVTYRLEKANEKYDLFENAFFVYQDCISCKEGISYFENGELDIYSILAKNMPLLNDKYAFNTDDVFIFHDVPLAYFAMLAGFPSERSIVVYHGQGSLYNEYLFFHEESEEMREILDKMTEEGMKWTKRVGFPSIGGMDALIETEPAIEDILNDKMVDILYNGCDCDGEGFPKFVPIETLNRINDFPGELKFVSVANLVEAKGVDRLPDFFAYLKNANIDFLWVIVGDGPKGEQISELINKYQLMDNVIWIPNRLPNSDILKLMKLTNFYIMGHRHSIFDFSTIEAMHMANIPVLTAVGGNKEMIFKDNGFFLSDDPKESYDGFINYYESIDVNEIKEMNREIAQEMFSEYSFLAGYEDVINCLCE